MRVLIALGIKNALRSRLRLMSGAFLLALSLIVLSVTVNVAVGGREEAKVIREELDSKILIDVFVPYVPGNYINYLTKSQIEDIRDNTAHVSHIWLYEGSGFGPFFYLENSEEDSKIIDSNSIDNNCLVGLDLKDSLPAYINRISTEDEGAYIPELLREYVEDGFLLVTLRSFDSYGKEIVKKDKIKVLGYFPDDAPVPLLELYGGLFESNRRIVLTKNIFFSVFNQYYRMNGAQSDVDRAGVVRLKSEDNILNDEIIKQLEDMGFEANTTDYDAQNYYSFVYGFEKMGAVIVIILLALSSVIIIQSVGRSLKRREKTVGVMRAFGYSWKNLLYMILSELTVYTLISLLLCVGGVMLLKKPVANLLKLMFSNMKYDILPVSILAAILAAVLIMAVYAMVFMRKWTRKSTVDLLKSEME